MSYHTSRSFGTIVDHEVPGVSIVASACSLRSAVIMSGSDDGDEGSRQGVLGALNNTGKNSGLKRGFRGISQRLAISCGHASASIAELSAR